jgi:hypothetical protein
MVAVALPGRRPDLLQPLIDGASGARRRKTRSENPAQKRLLSIGRNGPIVVPIRRLPPAGPRTIRQVGRMMLRSENILFALDEHQYSIIQAKTDSANRSQLLLQNQQDSAALDAKPSLTPVELLQRSRLKTAADDIGRRLADANTPTAQSLTKLTSGQCSGD